MTVTALPQHSDEPEGATVHSAATGLRDLVLSGQHFREQRAHELQLGTSDLAALGHLHHEGPMAPGKLAGLMGLTSGTMTALLDRVEKAGFLRRDHNPEDRRGLLINLTPAGQHAMQWLYGQYEDVVRNALARVPGLTADQLQAVLGILSESLSAEEHAPTASENPSAGATQPTAIHSA